MTVVNEWVAGTRFGGWVQRCRESRRLVLVIVAIALLLDNMLLTTVGKHKIFQVSTLVNLQATDNGMMIITNIFTSFNMDPKDIYLIFDAFLPFQFSGF
jgi:hypothetical protein